jgi:hypothetical protein
MNALYMKIHVYVGGCCTLIWHTCPFFPHTDQEAKRPLFLYLAHLWLSSELSQRCSQLPGRSRFAFRPGRVVSPCFVSYWETLTQCRKVSSLCALLKVYTGERAWRAIGDRLENPCYLSRVDHNRKIWSRKQKTDIGKYSFVNRTIQLWNQLPADVLGTLSCKPCNFRKRVRKVISKAKWRGDHRQGSEVNWSEVRCREVNCGWMKGRPHDITYFER